MVSAATVHMYIVYGVICVVTERGLAAVEIAAIWVPLFSAIETMYMRTMPFRYCGRGGSQ